MNFNFFKRKPRKSSDNFEIILKTGKNLSEVQEDTIFEIVTNGIKNNSELSSIAINIRITTGIHEPIVITRVDNGIEVIFK